ncbi:MAG: hypothetical protein ACFFDN_25150, partial [Candidatus Hodarchaeota archaeon]
MRRPNKLTIPILTRNLSEEIIISERLSSKYKRFIIGGFSRVFISRTFSFLYVLVISRLVAKALMDQMIILATGQLIILELTSFAMRYSCRQRALSVSGEKSDEIRYNGVSFMLIIATPISIILAVVLAIYVIGFVDFRLFFLFTLSMALLMIMEIELMIEKSLLAADKAIFLNMTYTVLNSILVPFLFYLSPVLESVLWAWNVSLVVTILFDIKTIVQVLRKKDINFRTMNSLFRFGFPIYLGSLPKLFSSHINKFLIFEFLETGATSIFYWPNRILSIIRETVFIVATGSTLLFNRLSVIDKNRLRDGFLGLFRIIAIISTVIYSWVYLDAAILIYIILGEGYIEAILFFRLLCIAWIFSSLNTCMFNLKDAQGHRRVMVKGSLLDFSSKILLLLILIHLGLIGV